MAKSKIKIIDAICEEHPSYGVSRGLSEYTGGMKDTGQWYIRKMLDCSKSELQAFLGEILAEKKKYKIKCITLPSVNSDAIVFEFKGKEYITSKEFMDTNDKFYIELELKHFGVL